MQAKLTQGPALLHWVAASSDLDADRAALRQLHGADPGEPTAAARGDFRWRITLRPDGLPQRGGAVPALIQWDGDAHPTDRLPPSPWRLLRLDTGWPEGLLATLTGPRTIPLP